MLVERLPPAVAHEVEGAADTMAEVTVKFVGMVASISRGSGYSSGNKGDSSCRIVVATRATVETEAVEAVLTVTTVAESLAKIQAVTEAKPVTALRAAETAECAAAAVSCLSNIFGLAGLRVVPCSQGYPVEHGAKNCHA